jgi:NADH-quinone oxidoreductase subunit G
MLVRSGGQLKATPVNQALAASGQRLKEIAAAGGTIAAIVSPFLTVEEAFLLASYVKELSASSVLFLGPVPTQGQDQVYKPDQHTGRTGDVSFVVPRPFTIRAEKCPNRRGVEAILQHYQGAVLPFSDLGARLAKKEFRALYVTHNAIDPWQDEASAKALRAGVEFLLVQDAHSSPLSAQADIVLAGATFAEKAGSYVNADGRIQYSEAALPPRDGSLPDLDLLAILKGRPGAGPIHSRDVLAELAAAVQAFSVASGGIVPEFGVPLAGTDGQATLPEAHPYNDPWSVSRYARTVH